VLCYCLPCWVNNVFGAIRVCACFARVCAVFARARCFARARSLRVRIARPNILIHPCSAVRVIIINDARNFHARNFQSFESIQFNAYPCTIFSFVDARSLRLCFAFVEVVFSVMKRMLFRCCFRRGLLCRRRLLKRPNVPIHHGSVMVVGRKSIHRQHPWRLPNPSGTLGGPIVSICTLGGYQSPAAPLEVNTSPIRRLRYVLRRFARSPP